MANAIIKGGTRSRVRTVRQAHKKWHCECGLELNRFTTHPGYRGKCDDCGRKRPT
jgi:hypothetical protein